MSSGGGGVIVEVDDVGADGQAEGEKASPTIGETDRQAATKGLTMPNTPPA